MVSLLINEQQMKVECHLICRSKGYDPFWFDL